MANTTPKPTHISLPPNTFGESALESSSTEPTPAESVESPAPGPQNHRVAALSQAGPKPPRVSFSRPPAASSSPSAPWARRPSRGGNSIFGRSSSRRTEDDAAGLLIPTSWSHAGSTHGGDRPPAIPSALNPSSDATPLPILSMIVLSIVMLGEFLSANVSTPFVLKMVKAFFTDPNNNPSVPGNPQENQADVGYWTGILVSVFFITQFITSLLWATVADKHGRRAVLFVSLLGNALTCTLFGFATNLPQAILIRLAQGVFNGAVGVARGAVTGITDTSNEGRAYAIMGFSWGLGGVVGAIIGGALESPAHKWLAFFAGGRFTLFVSYPYLLPCFVASCITGLGAFLCLFLGWDGGPRSGLIRLPDDGEDKPDDEQAPTPSHVEVASPSGIQGLSHKVSQKFSGYFARRVREDSRNRSPVPMGSVPGNGRSASVGVGTGSAYGYRSRLGSVATSVRRRRESLASAARAGDGYGSLVNRDENVGLAQRLFMANEHNVTNMTDLWVAAAITADNEEVFEDWDSSDISASEDESAQPATSHAPPSHPPPSHSSPSHVSPGQQTQTSSRGPSSRRSNTRSPTRPTALSPSYMGTSLQGRLSSTPARRASSSSSRPAIFANTGLAEDDYTYSYVPADDATISAATEAGSLAPIMERGSSAGGTDPSDVTATPAPLIVVEERTGSALSQLPMIIIFQYGLLALHNTTHDQIFLSYLVSEYGSGGLGLDPGHFAQLIALMCFAQIAFQFYLYPNIGPPLGRFSHLAMFRIGNTLFIPAYLSVVLYRHFASADNDGSLAVMILLSISTAIRYCGTTFAYTSAAVLLNYMSPPHVVSLSNGMAQSIVSLARFFGPVFGGYLWSVSVQDNPNGYGFGFYVCTAVCTLCILHSFTIR